MADQRIGMRIDVLSADAQAKLKAFQTTWTELKSQVDLATAVFKNAGRVAQEAFEFGKLGAEVRQTDESFGLLLRTVGASPDLFERLQEAAGGTISDFKLMSATSVLLAGAQGELATSLANATPELLEIARAANKLNPTLGDTTFLYESLALGIKRASPMILDNLGLTIKIGEANQRFADALGKSVEELTAEEQKQALLNETLRAGQVLINQVGGSVDSAADSYAQMEAAIENARNELATKFEPAVTRTVDALTLLVTWQDKVNKAFNNHVTNVLDTTDTYQYYVSEVKRAAEVGDITVYTTQQLNEIMRAGGEAVLKAGNYYVLLTEEQFNYGRVAEMVQSIVQDTAAGHDALANSLSHTTYEYHDLTEAVSSGKAVFEDSKGPIDELAESFSALDANLNLSSDIERMIEQMEFVAAGGAEIQKQINDAIAAYSTGGAHEGDEAWLNYQLENAYIATQNLDMELGNITAEQAAQNINDTLGVSLDDAMQILQNFITKFKNLDGSYVDVFINQTTRTGSGWGGGLGGLGVGNKKPYAHGGPLGAGDLAVVGERGPELFIPNSNGQVITNENLMNMLSGMGGGPTVVNVYLDGQQISGGVAAIMGRQARRKAVNAGAFTGI